MKNYCLFCNLEHTLHKSNCEVCGLNFYETVDNFTSSEFDNTYRTVNLKFVKGVLIFMNLIFIIVGIVKIYEYFNNDMLDNSITTIYGFLLVSGILTFSAIRLNKNPFLILGNCTLIFLSVFILTLIKDYQDFSNGLFGKALFLSFFVYYSIKFYRETQQDEM